MTHPLAVQYWLDGEPLTQPVVPIDAEGGLLRAGEAWFETLRVEAGRPLRLAAHLRRLRDSVARSGVGMTDLEQVLQGGLQPALLAAAQATERAAEQAAAQYPCGRLRVSLWPRSDRDAPAQVLVSLGAYQPPEAAYREGVVAVTARHPHPAMGWLGKSLSYHWSSAARREAASAGAEDSLFASAEGWLEAGTASLLWPAPAGWCTTSGRSGTLASVTVAALAAAGIPIDHCDFAPREAVWQRGLLLVSALRLVVAVRRLDDRSLPDLVPAAHRFRQILLSEIGSRAEA